jgi:hypothetical protein
MACGGDLVLQMCANPLYRTICEADEFCAYSVRVQFKRDQRQVRIWRAICFVG